MTTLELIRSLQLLLLLLQWQYLNLTQVQYCREKKRNHLFLY